MLENHVGVRKLAAQTALPLFQRLFACHLESGEPARGVEHEGKARGGIWTLAPIYRLEAGVIKQPLSGIQMRNLFCNPRTRGNDNVCFLVILRRDQSGSLWPTLSSCVSWWRQFYLALAECWHQTVKVLAKCRRRCWLSNFSWPDWRGLKRPSLKFDGWLAV